MLVIIATRKQMTNKFIIIFLSFLIICCNSSFTPGINEPSSRRDIVYIPEMDVSVKIIDINLKLLNTINQNVKIGNYTISPGDVLTFTVWGLNDLFPQSGIGGSSTNPLNSRQVGTNGEIFFPYVGKIKLEDLTVEEARDLISFSLSKKFVDPQIDLTISKFNENRKAYLLGEFLKPQPIYIGIETVTLTDAIGMASGLDPKFSNAKEIYIIRSSDNEDIIYRLNLSSSEKFLIANNFYLHPKDVVYVSASSVTKWNRVFAQIFPFAGFLNQVDNIRD